MKKVLVAVMALSLMAGVASCNKDEEEPVTSTYNTNELTVYEEHLGDGLYQPKLHINTIESNGSAISTFAWEGNLLKSLKENSSNVALNYTNEGRLKSSSYQGTTYNYVYNGNQVSCVRMTDLTGLMAHIDVTHSGDHITQMTYDSVSTLYLMQLASEYLNFGFKDNRKLSIGDATINETFAWEGDNVVNHTMTGTLTLGISPSEVSSMINISDLIHSYLSSNYPTLADNATLADLIDQLIDIIAADTREMPLDLQIEMNENYTYDSQRNYMQYFWPMGILVNTLSANNPLEYKQVVTLSATAHYTLPDDLPPMLNMLVALMSSLGLNTLDIPFSKEISKTSDSYTYQYNSYNFPTQVKSANNGEITIKYN